MSDLISRKAAIDEVHHAVYKFFDIVEDDDESPITHNDKRLLELNKAITSRLKELPSADRPEGKWIERNQNADGTHNIECNQCKEKYKSKGHASSIYTHARYKYCPNCGAKMGGDKGE